MSYYYDFEGYARPKKTIPQNVPYDTWAPQMWSQFTDLGNNFKSSQDFSSQVHNLINQIPCPECKTDGESYVKTNPPENITSKAQAQGWVTAYHNHVNQLSASKKGWGFASTGDLPWAGRPGNPGAGPNGGPGGISRGDPSQPGAVRENWGGGNFPQQGYAQDNFPTNVSLQNSPDVPDWMKNLPQGRTTYPGNPGLPGGGGGGGGAPWPGSTGGGGGGSGPHSGKGGGGGDPGIASRGSQRQNWGGGNFPQQGFSRDSRDPWYSDMWAQLHEYANDYNPLTFADDVRNQIEEIPAENERCYINSQEFMRKYPPEYVGNRQHAMYWMCRFHNQASLDAGNGLVDCELDPEGYGYVSGHDDYARDFFYGGGGGSRGGGQGGGGRGGGRHKRGGHGRGGGGGARGRHGGGMGPMGGGQGGPGFQPGGYATKKPQGPRVGIGGGPNLNQSPTPRHPWADEPGSPWHGNPGQHRDIDNPANQIDPNFIINKPRMNRNVPEWQRPSGYPISTTRNDSVTMAYAKKQTAELYSPRTGKHVSLTPEQAQQYQRALNDPMNNCICKEQVYTGLNCPIIGQPCTHWDKDIKHKTASIRSPNKSELEPWQRLSVA